MLDVAAVEGGDGLELVERDGQALLARGGDSAGQREHFGREARGVARGSHRGECHRDPAARRAAGCHRWPVDAHLGPDGLEQFLRPAPDPADRRVGGEQRPGVGFEESDVRARRGDRDLDRQDALPAEPAQHVADERRLAVAAGRDEEDLLALGEVLAQPGPLLLAVGERAGRARSRHRRTGCHAPLRHYR